VQKKSVAKLLATLVHHDNSIATGGWWAESTMAAGLHLILTKQTRIEADLTS